MKRIAIILAGWLWLTTSLAQAAHTQVRLLLSADTARPGDTVMAGVALKMEAGWHTYWKNPGAAGQATDIKWQLPDGVTAGEIQWPLPEKLPPAEVTTYAYRDEVMLLVPLKLAGPLPPGPLEISAQVSWLECKDTCLPASQTVAASLTIGNSTQPSAAAPQIDAWQHRLPQSGAGLFQAQAGWLPPAEGDLRTVVFKLDWLQPAAAGPPQVEDFFPAASDEYEVQPENRLLTNAPGATQLAKGVKKFSGDWPKTLSGVLVLNDRGTRTGFALSVPIREPGPAASVTRTALVAVPAANPQADTTAVAASPDRPFWLMLIYAFIGGLILNIMPCVLPVIALKILGFVSEARNAPGEVRLLGLIYSAGVLVSFLALAGVVLAVKLAGHQAAWGMQFGNPVFLVCLVTLVTLVALNLFGLFEVTLASGAMNVASGLSSQSGRPGAFFNGMLATVLATPCTAPILGSALGFAFTQPAWVLTAIFLAIGVGLASPYLILSWNPAWLKFLPKPGAWMEKFKHAMGFPMLAAAFWLYNIAASTYGKSVIWLGIFLVFVAAAAWTFGTFVQRGRSRRNLSLGVALLLLVGGYGYALEAELNWRHPVIPANPGQLEAANDGLAWQPWSPAVLAQARAAGRPVLVDFTADWCLTCQVNKKTSLETAPVRGKIQQANAITLLADYTHTPDDITRELARFNRAGVPLVLVYPRDPHAPPVVLPEVLTPGIVLAALEQAAR